MKFSARLLVGALGIAIVSVCGAQSPPAARALLEQAAEAMGGLERLRGLDNVVLTGFGIYLSQQGGGNLSPDSHAPSKWQEANAAQRTFYLKDKRALYRDRRISMFPFAAASGNRWNETRQVQTDIQTLDHPLTALLAALDPSSRLGPVRTESDLAVVEVTVPNSGTLWIALDARTRLPARVRWISASAALGDVTNTTYFTGYLPFDGVQLPTGFKTMIDWRDTTTAEFQADSYRLNVRDVPPVPGFALISPPPGPQVEVKPVAKGVWDVRYGGNAGAVIEFADHLTMFEAYGSEAATFARLDAANKLVQGKQVTEVIVSHHHFDHSGGLRAAVSRGLTIISRRANEEIFREMVARPAPTFPDALARNPQPLKFVPVDEHLALEDQTMRVDVYHAVGHLHMADAVFAYVPSARVLMEGDFTTFDWDYNWWGGAYLDNVERYKLDPAINVPVHGKVTTYAETIADIERQVANARKFCTESAAAGIFTAGCPVPGK